MQETSIPTDDAIIIRLFLDTYLQDESYVLHIKDFKETTGAPQITTSLSANGKTHYVNCDERIFDLLSIEETCLLVSKLGDKLITPDYEHNYDNRSTGFVLGATVAHVGNKLINYKERRTRRQFVQSVISPVVGGALGTAAGSPYDDKADKNSAIEATYRLNFNKQAALRQFIGNEQEVEKVNNSLSTKLQRYGVTINDQNASKALASGLRK